VSTPEAGDTAGAVLVTAGQPELWHFYFQRGQSLPAPREAVNAVFDIAVSRQHKRHLVVVLSAKINSGEWAEVYVQYRLGCVVRGPVADDLVEDALRELANYTIPTTLLPFIRETVFSVTQRSGIRGIGLPFYSVEDLFPEGVEVPTSDVEPPPELLTLPESVDANTEAE
jgi:preprotein translocase subunit SecB